MRSSNLKLSESLTIQGANASLLQEDDINCNQSIILAAHALPTDAEYGPSKGWCAQWKQLSYNIKLILIYTLLWGASISIWNTQLLATYIFQISGNSTETLGFIEAIQGGAYLLAAIIAGILTDSNISRISIIRFSGIIGLFLVVPLGCFTLLYVNSKYDDKHANQIENILYKSVYYIWLFLYGICASFSNTIISTVFADLVPKGNRDFIFSFQWFIRRMASTLGPIVIVAMFFFLGNHWKISEMNVVLLSGVGLWCLPLIMLIFGFNTKTLDITTKINDEKEEQISIVTKVESKYTYLIPWIMLCHRLTMATGAGMTVKFFPIFFEDVIGLKPIALNSIYIATPFATAMFTILVERCANKSSRIMAIIIFKFVGICCLIIMALITRKITKYANIILVSAYVIRTAAMNCAYPLEKAVLMDHVDKKNRGKWNAFESVNSTVWTLSAAAGGFLISLLGYRDIYFITASIYAFAVCILLPLTCITK